MKPYQQYMCALLQNPEWMKSTIARYGRHDSVGAVELATAVSNLEDALRDRFDVDECADSGEAPLSNEFEVEGFLKDSDPPPCGDAP